MDYVVVVGCFLVLEDCVLGEGWDFVYGDCFWE